MKSTKARETEATVDNAIEAADEAIRSSSNVASEALHKIAGRLDGMRGQASATVDRFATDAQALKQRGMEAVRESSEQVRQRALQATDTTAAYVKDEPFKSILIAAAIGAGLMALVGLMGRGKSERDD